jgi:endonuclease YncB( thermonuclease family)
MRDTRVRRLIVALVVAAAALWLGAMGGEGTGPAAGDGTAPTADDRAPASAAGDAGRASTDDGAPASADGPVPSGAQRATVTRVVDGDTIRVRVDDGGGALTVGEHRVRLLEIDSPEMDTDSGGPECGAAEATAFLRARLPRGAAVWLEADREDADRFGRALRYVWTPGGRLLNRALVATGNARAVLFAPNDRHWAAMTAAQTGAQAEDAGIWGACEPR